ncbi:single-stranded-DNA-specific exonuclease RecJ, partial [Candidatus Gottesmanbacteria bacterium]|nr:single-stranded-DNA-specific exonuclease RecJ [Candidatus Gottesmanbacteria bacterium]
MKRWEIQSKSKSKIQSAEDIVKILFENRSLKSKKEIEAFLRPPEPFTLTSDDVGIQDVSLKKAVVRIKKAIKGKESIVVYADYDADGITAGAVMWESLYRLGANVMPYIPHRVEEGYGLSTKGIDAVRETFNPELIITVDHGITAWEKVDYAKSLGIDVIVTDHHVKPKKLPQCLIVHTTKLSGAGVSWFLAKEVTKSDDRELVALAAIGTIADMVPLIGPNRSIAKYGLASLNKTKRVGLDALIADAGLQKGDLGTYDVSHMIAPRLNAMGRLEHALDALRLLCTRRTDKATLLAQKLGLTNRERQQLTTDTVLHAMEQVKLQGKEVRKKLLFITHETYNQGVIGLVAGRLVEMYYRPAIVVAKGEQYSKASARSIAGFNIVEAIRQFSDILVDVGGHPMAAGFTVETKHLKDLQGRLEKLAERELDEEKLMRKLRVDAEISLRFVSEQSWRKIQEFAPFGFGNPEPVFSTRGVSMQDVRLVGKDGKHLKLSVGQSGVSLSAIAFSLGDLYR